MPKLLIVSQHFWPENFRVNDLALGIMERGIQVDVLCGLPNYPKGEWFPGYGANGPFEEDYHGAHVYRCREIPRTGNTSLGIFLNYISWPAFAACSIRRLPGGYDAVLCYNTSPVLMAWPAIRASKKFAAPFVNYVFDLWPENLYSVLNIRNGLARKMAQSCSDSLYREADGIIALSDEMRDNLVARVGRKRSGRHSNSNRRFGVIPQYCEDFYAAKTPSQNDHDEDCFTLMFTGNLSPAQDLEGVMESVSIAARFLEESGQRMELKFVLYGDGMSRDSILAAISAWHLHDIVELRGSIPATDIPVAVQEADALLVSLSGSPSLGLTIPAKLASSMAARKPLLVSISGAGAKAAEESGGALVCEAEDRLGLAANIIAMALASRDELAALGERSFEYYQSHYQRDRIIDEIVDFVFEYAR